MSVLPQSSRNETGGSFNASYRNAKQQHQSSAFLNSSSNAALLARSSSQQQQPISNKTTVHQHPSSTRQRYKIKVTSAHLNTNGSSLDDHAVIDDMIATSIDWWYDLKSSELAKEFHTFIQSDGLITSISNANTVIGGDEADHNKDISSLPSTEHNASSSSHPPGRRRSIRKDPLNIQNIKSTANQNLHHQYILPYFFVLFIALIVFLAFPMTWYHYISWLLTSNTQTSTTSIVYKVNMVMGVLQCLGLFIMSIVGIYLCKVHCQHVTHNHRSSIWSFCCWNFSKHFRRDAQTNSHTNTSTKTGMTALASSMFRSSITTNHHHNHHHNHHRVSPHSDQTHLVDVENNNNNAVRDSETSPTKKNQSWWLSSFSMISCVLLNIFPCCSERNNFKTLHRYRLSFFLYGQLVYFLFYIQMVVLIQSNVKGGLSASFMNITWLPDIYSLNDGQSSDTNGSFFLLHGLLLLLCPYFMSLVIPSVSMRWLFINVIVNLNILLITSTFVQSFHSWLVYILISLIVTTLLIDKQRHSLRLFFSFRITRKQFEDHLQLQLKKEMESNKNIESKYVLEMKHMISNVAHDLKTVSVSTKNVTCLTLIFLTLSIALNLLPFWCGFHPINNCRLSRSHNEFICIIK
jgi:hypothetical protein